MQIRLLYVGSIEGEWNLCIGILTGDSCPVLNRVSSLNQSHQLMFQGLRFIQQIIKRKLSQICFILHHLNQIIFFLDNNSNNISKNKKSVIVMP